MATGLWQALVLIATFENNASFSLYSDNEKGKRDFGITETKDGFE